MGVDFEAIFEHRLATSELEDLPDRLPFSGQEDRWRWCLEPGQSSAAEQLRNGGYVRLRGPTGSLAYVGAHCFVLLPRERWFRFLNEPEVRRDIRAQCRDVASVLGADAAIYIPDTGSDLMAADNWAIDEGVTTAEIAALMAQNFGPPADLDHAETLAEAEEYDFYFVDHFPSSVKGVESATEPTRDT